MDEFEKHKNQLDDYLNNGNFDSTAGPVNALEVAPLCVASDH